MTYQYKREPLTEAEDRALRAAAIRPYEKLIVTMFLETGVRVSELSELRAEQIDWQRRTVTIYGKGGPAGHNSKRRVIPLSDSAMEVLVPYVWMLDPGKYFTSIPTIQRRVKDVASRAAIVKKVSPHVLRHTFAVTCLRRGIHPVYLMYLLGHEHYTTTQGYLNLSPEDVIADFRLKWNSRGVSDYGQGQDRRSWTNLRGNF